MSRPLRPALALMAVLAFATVSATRSAATQRHDEDEPRVRAFPLQREATRSVAWLEVTGPEASQVDPGVEEARLVVGRQEYAAVRAQIKRYEGPEQTVALDDLKVQRTRGATYLRFEFPAVTGDEEAQLSWIWHRREPGAPLTWSVPSLGSQRQALGARTTHGLRVSVPAAGWQEGGEIRLANTELRGLAARSAWFHLVVRPDAARGSRFPEGYVGYKVRLLSAQGEDRHLLSANSAATVGGQADAQHILTQFDVPPAEGGTLEWTPLFARSMDREYLLKLPQP